jgi:hypothetical protein
VPHSGQQVRYRLGWPFRSAALARGHDVNAQTRLTAYPQSRRAWRSLR